MPKKLRECGRTVNIAHDASKRKYESVYAHLGRDNNLRAVDVELLEDAAHLDLGLAVRVDLGAVCVIIFIVSDRPCTNATGRGEERWEGEGEGRRRRDDGLVEEVDSVIESGLDQILDGIALYRAADRKPPSVREAAV